MVVWLFVLPILQSRAIYHFERCDLPVPRHDEGHTDWPFDFVSKPGVASVSPEHGGTVPIRKAVVLWPIAGEGTKFRSAVGGAAYLFLGGVLRSGVLPIFERVALVADSGFTSPFRKNVKSFLHPWGMGQKWTHGIERLPEGKA